MKMKKGLGFCLVFLLLLSVQGCLYSNVQRPLDTDFNNTTLGAKVGYSHATSILWLFAWGDAGTRAAAEDGGIITIKHADSKIKVMLFGLYTHTTTVVYGD